MKKEQFVGAIEPYLFINKGKDIHKEIYIDNYIIYIDLKKNKLTISVLNEKTERTVDLSSNKYKSYIKPILDISQGYEKKGCFYTFNLKESITEDTTTKGSKNSDKVKDTTKNTTRNIEDEIIENIPENDCCDYELTYMLNGYEFVKTFRSMMTLKMFVDTVKNDSYKKLYIKEVPKRKVGAKAIDFTTEDKNKLNSLLENYDILMELANNHTTKGTTINTTSEKIDLSTKNTKVTSIRLNKGLHQELKKRVEETKENIGELINKAIFEYLNK